MHPKSAAAGKPLLCYSSSPITSNRVAIPTVAFYWAMPPEVVSYWVRSTNRNHSPLPAPTTAPPAPAPLAAPPPPPVWVPDRVAA